MMNINDDDDDDEFTQSGSGDSDQEILTDDVDLDGSLESKKNGRNNQPPYDEFDVSSSSATQRNTIQNNQDPSGMASYVLPSTAFTVLIAALTVLFQVKS